MGDSLSYLLENKIGLDTIQRLMRQKCTGLDELAAEAKSILDRGGSLTEMEATGREADNPKGKPVLTLTLLEECLQDMSISVRLNVVSREVSIMGVDSEFDPEALASQLHIILHDYLQHGFRCNKDKVADLLAVIAGKNRFNPVIDMLNSAEWDGTDRVQELCSILHISEDDALSKTLLTKWLCQCIVMAWNQLDGAQGADGVLVLQGPQGIGKTSFVRQLGMRPDLYKLGQYLDSRDKDTLRRCTSAWITELGEIETTLRSDLERLKAFITSETDQYRLPYGRCDQLNARRTSFIATCNSERFLIDPTGSRRFWTIPVEKVDLERLRAFNSLQLWLEVKQLVERQPNHFRLTQGEQKALAQRNLEHEKPLKAQMEIEDILSEADSNESSYLWKFETVSVFKEANDSLRSYSAEQIGRALDKLGITSERKKISGSVLRARRLPFKRYGTFQAM